MATITPIIDVYKRQVYTRRRTAKSTLLREKTKEGFYVEREKMVSNAVEMCIRDRSIAEIRAGIP